jgi:hypothetical protein
MPSKRARLFSLLPLAVAFGCQSMNTPLYFQGDPVTDSAGDDTPTSNGLTLRFRNPTAKEQMDLDAQTAAANYGGDVPWVSRDKIHLELTYRVTNTSDTEGTFNLMVDGASQYEKYDSNTVAAALQQGNDAPTFLPLMQSRPTTLAPGASATGLLREDDFAEATSTPSAAGTTRPARPSRRCSSTARTSIRRGRSRSGWASSPGFGWRWAASATTPPAWSCPRSSRST